MIYKEHIKSYYDGFAEEWDTRFVNSKAFEYFLTRRLAVLKSHLGKFETIVDAGCGTGYYIRNLLSVGQRGLGFDLSPNMIAQATKKKASLKPELDLSFQVMDGEHLAILDNSFDRAICVGYLIHLEQPQVALNELYRVLKPGGRLVGLISNRWSPWLVFNLRGFFAKDYGVLPQDKELSPPEVRKMMQAAGFKNIQISMFNTLPGKLPNWAYYPARVANALFALWPISYFGFHILVTGEK